MDFHVGHAGILILKAAFEAPESLAEQRQLPEARCAVSQSPPKKIHLQGNEIAICVRVLNRLLDLVREFGCQNLIGVEKQNPVVSQGQRVHCPLALLRPASRIMELDNLGAMRLSNDGGVVRTLRIDDIDFADGLQRLQATPKVMRLIADGNNYGQGEHRRGCPRSRYFSFWFRFDHVCPGRRLSYLSLQRPVFTKTAVLVSLSELCPELCPELRPKPRQSRVLKSLG